MNVQMVESSSESRPTLRSRQLVSRAEFVARNGAVAATRYHESVAGLGCLEDGGTAVDAAVAAAFVACVIEPFSTSIGGGGFMLVHDPASQRQWSFEFPVRAPAAARGDMFQVIDDAAGGGLGTFRVEGDANSTGYLAAAVPGTVAGLVEAHRRFGRLPLSRIVQPAVDVARRGFRGDLYYAALAATYRPLLARYPMSAARLLVDGHAPVALLASRLPQPELADALEQIGVDAGESFHRGDIAAAIVRDIEGGGGIISLDDLASYEPIVTQPTTGRYRGYDVAVPSSPCGGWTALQALAILEHTERHAAGRESAAQLHTIIEALRHAFADRYAFLGDPEGSPVPLGGILSGEYAKKLAALIRPDAVDDHLHGDRQPWAAFLDAPVHDPWEFDDGDRPRAPLTSAGPGARHGTVHVCAADRDGMVVSCTHTIGDIFGAKCMAGPGVLLNAGMQWFSPQPGGPNSIAPGRRPLANMAPAIVTREGRPVLAVGAFGGRRIVSAIVQIISGVVDHGLSPQRACEAPRVDASERVTYADDRLATDALAQLRHLGHDIQPVREDHNLLGVSFANATAIGVEADGSYRCGVDAVRPCEAVGY